ncbi:MAG TPA: hypothetical protein EYN86_00580 [Planctomycetes bacterium]|jgi:hypothetical protein|nr:hypothetical protein [Planctomycetota bacterium]
MVKDWQYSKRNQQCSDCEHSFTDGEDVFSMLRMFEGDLQRADLCRACFDARDESTDVVYWRTSQHENRQALRLDFDMLLALLEKLLADERDDRKDLSYLLSLLLVRHRKLRLERVQMKGPQEVMLLRKTRTKKTFAVESREMTDERRSELSKQLTELVDPTKEANI